MENVLTAGGGVPSAGSPCVSRAQMPLSFLRSGQKALVAKVRGQGEMHRHLETLGFVEGATVRVVSEMAGNLIVEVKGVQIALDKHVALRIVTH